MADPATLWTVAHQGPLSMGFSRRKCWSGLLCPPPGDLPDPGTKPHLLHLLLWQAGSLPLAPPGKPMMSVREYDMVVDEMAERKPHSN